MKIKTHLSQSNPATLTVPRDPCGRVERWLLIVTYRQARIECRSNSRQALADLAEHFIYIGATCAQIVAA